MNLNYKPYYSINGVMFDNHTTCDNVIVILDAPKPSKNIEPSTELIKGLRDFLIEVDNDESLADMLYDCFNGPITQIVDKLNEYTPESESITRRYNYIVNLLETGKAFRVVVNTKTLESLTNLMECLKEN